MSELVNDLRDKWKHSEELCYAAAARFEALEAEIERLRAALEDIQAQEGPCSNSTVRRMARFARAALAGEKAND